MEGKTRMNCEDDAQDYEQYRHSPDSIQYMIAEINLRQRGVPLTEEAVHAEMERIDAEEACALMQEYTKIYGDYDKVPIWKDGLKHYELRMIRK
jgi:hypothetical protein